MDTHGQFYREDTDGRPTAELDPAWPRFEVGQVINVGGVPMRVRKVTRKDVVLRPYRGPQGDAGEEVGA